MTILYLHQPVSIHDEKRESKTYDIISSSYTEPFQCSNNNDKNIYNKNNQQLTTKNEDNAEVSTYDDELKNKIENILSRRDELVVCKNDESDIVEIDICNEQLKTKNKNVITIFKQLKVLSNNVILISTENLVKHTYIINGNRLGRVTHEDLTILVLNTCPIDSIYELIIFDYRRVAILQIYSIAHLKLMTL